jgi:hypothetical protein
MVKRHVRQTLNLTLEKGKKYTATIYADAKMRIIKQTRKPMLFK